MFPGIKNGDTHHKNGMKGGARHPVGNKRMTVREITELTGKSRGYVDKCLKRESAEKFIKRVGVKP